MHKVSLSLKGQHFVIERANVDQEKLESYPEGVMLPTETAWTVSDDIMAVLASHINVIALTDSYPDQLEAVIDALSPMHGRLEIMLAFRALCKEGYIDCVYNLETSLDDLANIFSALANPVRLQMLQAFRSPSTVTELKHLTGKEAATLYRHIGKLRELGIIVALGHGEGYVIDDEVVTQAAQTLLTVFGHD